MSAWVAMVRAEALKVRTVRASLAVALALVLLEVLFKTISVVLLQEGAGPVEVLGALRPSISFPVVCAVLGVLPAAAEWRHGTAAPTYSVQPRRTVVLGAKTVVAAVVGATGGLLATATALTAALVVAAQRGLATPAPSQVAATALGSVGAALLLAALGVAVGTLLRDQTGALAVVTAVLFVLAPLALLLDPSVYAWTPSGAVDASAAIRPANPDLLAQPGGFGLLSAYTASCLMAAAWWLGRRDVA